MNPATKKPAPLDQDLAQQQVLARNLRDLRRMIERAGPRPVAPGRLLGPCVDLLRTTAATDGQLLAACPQLTAGVLINARLFLEAQRLGVKQPGRE